MKTQPFHIEVIRERERGEEIGELFVSTEWSSSVRHRDRDCVITNQFFVPFEIVKDVGEIGFLSGETSSHGTEELMAKTIRVREKYFSYNHVHRT